MLDSFIWLLFLVLPHPRPTSGEAVPKHVKHSSWLIQKGVEVPPIAVLEVSFDEL